MQRILRVTLKYYCVLVLVPLIFGVILLSEAQACSGTGIDVTKFCTDASGPGEPINFFGTVTNTGCVPLSNVRVIDLLDGSELLYLQTLAAGVSVSYSGSYTPTESPSTNTVRAEGEYGCETVWAEASATCEVPGEGGEGCTPGYFKNPKHFDDWIGYSPGDDFDTTFGVDLFDPDITLGEAVRLGGGGVKKLARHGTAALLSAAHSGVDYPLTVDQVINAVKAGDADTLADANELGCPL